MWTTRWSTPQTRYHFLPDRSKAALAGVTVAEIARTLRLALSGEQVGTLHVPTERHPLHIELRMDRAARSSLEALNSLQVRGTGGNLVPLGELGVFQAGTLEPTIYHKNLERVVYVFGEMAGRSPVNAILNIGGHFDDHPLPEGTRVVWSGEGEWKITLDVFRDLGLAFGAALVLIYILLILETGSYAMPLIIMGAIPLTMIGIMPGFWLLNLLLDHPVGGFHTPVFFTATAMIGMIALAGIVVRNSIILIDFIHHALKRGVPLREALVESGAVRLRPILLDRRSGPARQLGHHPRPDLLRAGLVDHLRRLRLHRVHPDRHPRGLLADLRPRPGNPCKEIPVMTVNRYLRLIAGFFVMLSVALSQLHSPYWLFFTAFVGLNLFQSAFSNWCPMITILRKLGIKEG